MSTGEREIVAEEAATIRRIFKDYAAGQSPIHIAKALNAEGLRGPRRGVWSSSTIHGNPKRGIGILHNELYVGRIVWNRQRFLKDPDTGKRVTRFNPESEWVTSDVPHLRIVDDELWGAVQARYASIQRNWSKAPEEGRFNQFHRPKYLFSGLTKCGECGAGFITYSREHLGCFGARGRGTCTNRLTISRKAVEERVLGALQEKLFCKEFFDEFCREFANEMNRLRMEQREGVTSARREVARISTRIKKLLDLVLDDEISVEEGKAEIKALDSRRNELNAQLKAADEPPPLLHPIIADLYRSKVESLADALQREDTRLEASEMLRGLIDSIVLIPEPLTPTLSPQAGRGSLPEPSDADSAQAATGSPRRLRIELKGNLAAMLAAAQQTKRSPETGDLIVSVQMVAGAHRRLYRRICWTAA